MSKSARSGEQNLGSDISKPLLSWDSTPRSQFVLLMTLTSSVWFGILISLQFHEPFACFGLFRFGGYWLLLRC